MFTSVPLDNHYERMSDTKHLHCVFGELPD